MNEESDVTFHFRVNFGNWVAVNSDVCGVWWSEVTCHSIPFEDGKPFDLHISVLDSEYQTFAFPSLPPPTAPINSKEKLGHQQS
ncbi:hypothetical protein P7K49_034350 [Saguinus oedipus]|uniref:Galectin n=1 Tax=Saguinus oedipus TaxID=9490 RepID=A0ABQ9TUH2_SAGOE|nr:hypothetical protein P7K49_034350 [Saguinus oedipus]